MAVTAFFVFFFATNLLLSTSYSAIISRVSERDLGHDIDRVARADSYSFHKDYGNTQFGSYYNKEDDSGGFNASHKFDNGNFAGNFDWGHNGQFSGGFGGEYKDNNGGFDGKIDVDKDGKLSGGAKGQYSWNGGKTKVGGNLNFGKDGTPAGAFSFFHSF